MTFQYLVAIPIRDFRVVKRHSLFDYTFYHHLRFSGLTVPSFIQMALSLMFFTYTTTFGNPASAASFPLPTGGKPLVLCQIC